MSNDVEKLMGEIIATANGIPIVMPDRLHAFASELIAARKRIAELEGALAKVPIGIVTTENFDRAWEKDVTVRGEIKASVVDDVLENLARETDYLREEIEAEAVNAREARLRLSTQAVELERLLANSATMLKELERARKDTRRALYWLEAWPVNGAEKTIEAAAGILRDLDRASHAQTEQRPAERREGGERC